MSLAAVGMTMVRSASAMSMPPAQRAQQGQQAQHEARHEVVQQAQQGRAPCPCRLHSGHSRGGKHSMRRGMTAAGLQAPAANPCRLPMQRSPKAALPTCERHEAKAAAVWASPRHLKLINDLHRSHLHQ